MASVIQAGVAWRRGGSGFANRRLPSLRPAAADWTLSVLALVQRLRRERYCSARHEARSVAGRQTAGALPPVLAWWLRSGALTGGVVGQRTSRVVQASRYGLAVPRFGCHKRRPVKRACGTLLCIGAVKGCRSEWKTLSFSIRFASWPDRNAASMPAWFQKRRDTKFAESRYYTPCGLGNCLVDIEPASRGLAGYCRSQWPAFLPTISATGVGSSRPSSSSAQASRTAYPARYHDPSTLRSS